MSPWQAMQPEPAPVCRRTSLRSRTSSVLNASTSSSSVTRRHRQTIRSEQMASAVELAIKLRVLVLKLGLRLNLNR
jgi:hypothetical protein